jgi:hypothetical protein
MSPKEKSQDIIDYIAGTHLRQYGKIHMKSVLEEASVNVRLIIKNRIIDGLDVTYWREVRKDILARQ